MVVALARFLALCLCNLIARMRKGSKRVCVPLLLLRFLLSFLRNQSRVATPVEFQHFVGCNRVLV